MSISKRLEILNEAKSRVALMAFGDPVTNVCAGDGNPERHAYFVAKSFNSRKNRFGITHTDYLVRLTDKKGKFWRTDVKVVFPGHLSAAECKELFDPIWESEYGGQK